jgi:hypothetical protein
MKYQDIREEELKNKIGQDFFSNFDTTKIVGNIDFCVTHKIKNSKQEKLFENDSLLLAEAKRGSYSMLTMMTQLVLTIGKARTFDKFLPPAFLGAFDSSKIGFVPYNAIMEVFSMNDFNWNVTPSNHETREFKLIKDKIELSLDQNHYVFDFVKDEKELQFFIKNNIAKATESGKILIDKNNFVPIYLRWLDQVKPSIDFNWVEGRKQNIHDSDFYLADLFVDDKGTSDIDDDTPLNDNLFVVFKNSHYEIAKENIKQIFDASIQIKDKKSYEQFWKKYKRPPLEEIQQHIVARKDLLIPQDIRERKGAFFTPKKWVELSQQYIADVLGDDWQDEYYVWDCAAGTGNLLAGLTNKYNIWASTLDQSDVNAMHDRIENGAILLKDHCFQFDFLNDDFSKLPQGLQDIIDDEEKRKKLVVYINPPYAEASDKKTLTKNKEGKQGVEQSNTNKKYSYLLGQGNAEIFAQFFIRINKEIPGAVLAEFSKLKILQGQHFSDFRKNFRAKLERIFVVPADTFDNVKGKFPIGFFIWNSSKDESFKEVTADVFDKDGLYLDRKHIVAYNDDNFINEWIKPFRANKNDFGIIGKFPFKGNDFQNQNMIAIVHPVMIYNKEAGQFLINSKNLIKACIYFAVRHCIEATWLNDRDQFLYPDEGWQDDLEFQNDCLAFTLFNTNIQSKFGTNNWIPFSEQEVNAQEKFESNFMTQFIKGKIKPEEKKDDLFSTTPTLSGFKTKTGLALEFSEQATTVFNAGRALWKYYHAQPNVNVNASLYDIREHFQGRNDKGKMNNKSQDEQYMKLITELRESLKILAKKIEPKVYEYGFLKN